MFMLFVVNLFLISTSSINIKVSNSLDPDQARQNVGHDPNPSSLQR